MIKKLLNSFKLNFSNNMVDSSLERIAYDESVKKYQCDIEKRKGSLPSLTAVYRVKNASLYIELSILSIAPICSEIIIVDNNSSDDTLDKIEQIKEKLKDRVDIRIFTYNKTLAIAGKNYKNELNSENSLAKYYEFCFSKATSDYVMKCDAHLLYNPNIYSKIQTMLNKNRRVIIFRGVEVYGKNLPFERYIFLNDNNFYYKDGDFYEELMFKYKLTKLEQFRSTIFSPVFIHYKRINYFYFNAKKNLVNYLYK